MKKFKVTDIGTYWGSKEIDAETREEAREKYINDPCNSDDYDYEGDRIEIEEVKDSDQGD